MVIIVEGCYINIILKWKRFRCQFKIGPLIIGKMAYLVPKN